MRRNCDAMFALRCSIILAFLLAVSGCSVKLIDIGRSTPRLNLSEEQSKVVQPKMMAIKEIAGKYELEKEELEEETIEPSKPLDKKELMGELEALGNTLLARFYNSNLERISEVPVRDVIKSLGDTKDVHAIVFDGIITQRLADLASKQGVKILVGLKIGNVNKVPENIEIITKGK